MEWYTKLYYNADVSVISVLKSLSVTLIYAGLNAVLTMVFSIAVALLLNRSFKGRGIFGASFFLVIEWSDGIHVELDTGLSEWFVDQMIS
ncbi:MAG: hypothetical protein V8S76_06375 [Lachnospiraceae bacterium]